MHSSSVATRTSLIERARLRDDSAWRELVALYSPLVVVWCRSCRASPEATADCLQDVFAALARSLDTYDATGRTGAFRTWLWAVTRNKLRDAMRREARQIHGVGGSSALDRLAQVPDPITIPETEPSQLCDLHALTARGLAQIEHEFHQTTWQAFWRTVVDEQSTEQVASELGLSVPNVRQARSRVLRRLRRQLGDEV